MKLQEAFNISPGEVISLVGGGGKTTLMFALARELAGGGSPVVTTTTTRILEPSPDETELLITERDELRLIEALTQNINRYRHITVASERPGSGKLKGVSPEAVDRVAGLKEVPYIIVEADGAAGRSLKAPGPDEPVIPISTTLVIAVVGIDAVGCRLSAEHVFRAEIAQELLGLLPDAVVTTDAVALLITHRQGIIKGSPAVARVVPFINKIDSGERLSLGRELASRILAMKHHQIERVVLGQAKSAEPVAEVID